jgi:hypothetical protein
MDRNLILVVTGLHRELDRLDRAMKDHGHRISRLEWIQLVLVYGAGAVGLGYSEKFAEILLKAILK